MILYIFFQLLDFDRRFLDRVECVRDFRVPTGVEGKSDKVVQVLKSSFDHGIMPLVELTQPHAKKLYKHKNLFGRDEKQMFRKVINYFWV